MNTLLTGASGFAGQRYLHLHPHTATKSIRGGSASIEKIDWTGISSVLHMAGIAHRMEKTPDSLYENVNYKLTTQLANVAKTQGVKHFIFLSTIKVYGDDILSQGIVNEETPCEPNDAYGLSKLKAEQSLLALTNNDFKVSIIRPPLITGPGAKGNLLSLMKLAQSGLPLPFGNIENTRSMVYIDNLIALIQHLLEHPQTGIFLITDPERPSTSELITQIRLDMSMQPRLVSIPSITRRMIKTLKPEIHQRLFGSIIIDPSNSFKRLAFYPPQSWQTGIHSMVKDFLS